MSVRRLADVSFQPEKFAFSDTNARWAEATIRKYPEGRQQSAVIPLLMRAQDQEGWVTKPAIEYVADRLSMPLIRVLEVATFYTQFQLKPVGTRAHVQVCGTTPCMLRGAEDLKAVCREKIHPEPFHRNGDGTMSWEEVECLGACVNAPMVMIFEDTYEDLTPERLEEMLDLFEAGRGGEVKPGPQNGRHESVPIGGLTSLTGKYDDRISDAPGEPTKETGRGGPANGAPPQGEGAGEAISPPSNAGYPNTQSAKTDPSIDAAGKATNGNVEPQQEDRPNDELVAKGHRAGAGQTGGAREGRTDAAERDAAEAGQVSGDTHDAERGDGSGTATAAPSRDDVRTDGNRREKEAAAEDAILSDSQRVDDSSGPQERTSGGTVDLSGKDQVGVTNLEGQRGATSDTATGPVHDDVFAGTEDDGDGTKAGERPRSMPTGEKPAGLLDAPKGDRDDLKLIRGIGPVIEAKLNELGVFHFWQIAGWSEPELVWIDDFLNFRGRALRERWIDQAKALQDGASDRTTV